MNKPRCRQRQYTCLLLVIVVCLHFPRSLKVDEAEPRWFSLCFLRVEATLEGNNAPDFILRNTHVDPTILENSGRNIDAEVSTTQYRQHYAEPIVGGSLGRQTTLQNKDVYSPRALSMVAASVPGTNRLIQHWYKHITPPSYRTSLCAYVSEKEVASAP